MNPFPYTAVKGFSGPVLTRLRAMALTLHAESRDRVAAIREAQARYGVGMRRAPPPLDDHLANLGADTTIPAGVELLVYSGALVNAATSRSPYLVSLPDDDELSVLGETVRLGIDGQHRRTSDNAAMCNHACEARANCGIRAVVFEGAKLPLIVLYSLRPIAPGEPLVWDYNNGVPDTFWSERATTDARLADPALRPRVVLCACGLPGPCPLGRSILLPSEQ
jgi:hypothetical protein